MQKKPISKNNNKFLVISSITTGNNYKVLDNIIWKNF